MEADLRTSLAELDRLRRGARADVHSTSTPLLAVGGAIAALVAVLGDPRSGSGLGMVVWLLATPGVFLLLARLERRRATKIGAGGPAGAYRRTALVVAVLLVLGAPTLLLGGPFLLPAGALVALGLATRRRRLAVWAGAIGAVGTAESFHAISNRWSGSYLPWLHEAVLVAVAAMFVLAGLYERAHERT